ncbi:MAG TPA: M48 family metallopeptidase [Candidatus Binatia bacterium]|nr:M48 family metallopeptidase [Candidatus Binatia bacterium]
MTPATITVLFLALFLVEFAVEFALNELNLAHARGRASAEIPAFFDGAMTRAEYEKSIAYTLARGRFGRWSSIYLTLVAFWVLFGGVLPAVDRFPRNLAAHLPAWTHAEGIIFCLAVAFIFGAASLPTGVYSTFVLEERFGFNKTTPAVYIADRLKGLALGFVIGVPFLFCVLWLMARAGPHWWFWVFLFIVAFQLLMVIVFPTLIAPLFNKFEPLKEGEFKQRILAMADKVGFRTGGIFTMDGSRRSAHSNAYFTGLGKAKRIVLFDTLAEQMTTDQGVAVLAHEMGHYKMKHIRRMLVLRSLFLLAGLYVLSLLVGYPPFFQAFGFDAPSNHAALALFSLLAGPATFYLTPLINYFSRKHEYEADLFAARAIGRSKPMEEALIKLTVDNLSNLTPHPWYSAYHYSHPTTAERIDAMREDR